MHCSSCEPVLDRYLEGTLPPRRLAAIAAHIQSCERCDALLKEVNVVDALLFTTRAPELPPNFTFAAMAEIQSMPPVRTPAHRVWSFLAIYSAAAWVAFILAIALTGTRPGAVLSTIAAGLTNIFTRGARMLGNAPHATPALATFGFGVLTLDAMLAVLVITLYFGVRPRLAAAIATSRRAGHD